jgi:multidrug efflux pump subunit AcrA (membrane-fusion protein)
MRMLAVAVAVALLLPLGAGLAQTASPKAAAPRPAAASAAPRVSAIFMAEQLVALRAATDARVVSVAAQEGLAVRRGTVLVQLDDREQRARVALAARAAGSDADVRAADARRREAEARLDGTLKAAGTGAATEWEVRQARAAATQAAEDSRAAQDRRAIEGRRLSLEQVMLENYVLRAPFDGRVTRIGARPGMSVRKSDVLATVANLSVLRGEAFVPVAHYGRLRVGATYPVVFAAPFRQTAAATLIYIDPVIEGGQVRAVFRLQNSGERIPSGLQGSIQLQPT